MVYIRRRGGFALFVRSAERWGRGKEGGGDDESEGSGSGLAGERERQAGGRAYRSFAV